MTDRRDIGKVENQLNAGFKAHNLSYERRLISPLMELNIGNYRNLKKVENPDTECFKCGAKEELYEDPNIEGMIFCKNCWEERIKTEILTELGMEEEIPFED